jgi:hypothetical protein
VQAGYVQSVYTPKAFDRGVWADMLARLEANPVIGFRLSKAALSRADSFTSPQFSFKTPEDTS